MCLWLLYCSWFQCLDKMLSPYLWRDLRIQSRHKLPLYFPLTTNFVSSAIATSSFISLTQGRVGLLHWFHNLLLLLLFFQYCQCLLLRYCHLITTSSSITSPIVSATLLSRPKMTSNTRDNFYNTRDLLGDLRPSAILYFCPEARQVIRICQFYLNLHTEIEFYIYIDYVIRLLRQQ